MGEEVVQAFLHHYRKRQGRRAEAFLLVRAVYPEDVFFPGIIRMGDKCLHQLRQLSSWQWLADAKTSAGCC